MKKLFYLICCFTVTKGLAQYSIWKEFINPIYETSRESLKLDVSVNDHSQNSVMATPDQVAYPDIYPEKTYVYQVVFHIVRNDQGIRQTGEVGEGEVMNIIRDLNLNYKHFGIYFKYKGFDYIDNTNLVGDIPALGITSSSYFGGYLSNHMFHVTILDGNVLVYDESVGSLVSSPGVGFRFSTLAFLSYQGATSIRVPSHEIGHCLNLWHDFKDYGDIYASERVTRFDWVDGYNALFTGDWVHDTPATRVWSLTSDNYNADGFYIGGDVDFNLSLPDNHIERYYKNYPPRFNNLMHVHEGQDLQMGYFLTEGQGRRIRWSLATDAVNNYGIWSLAETDRAELYLPFETQIVAGSEV